MKSKLLVICLFLIHKNILAQKLGIKPIIGISNNGSAAIYNSNQLFRFTEADQFEPRATYGLHITYRITPKISIESGLQNVASVLKYEVKDPDNFSNTIGRFEATLSRRTLHLGFSNVFKEINESHKLKTILAVTFLNTNRMSGAFRRPITYDVDTNVVLSTNVIGHSILNGYNKIAWGLMFGIGDEIFVKNNPVGEIRVIARYHFRPILGAYTDLKGSVISRNEYATKNLTFETSLLINLSSILGNKWRN